MWPLPMMPHTSLYRAIGPAPLEFRPGSPQPSLRPGTPAPSPPAGHQYWRPVQTCSLEDPRSSSWWWPLKHIWFVSGRYTSYWNAFLLPPAMKLGQGNVFTGICDSVNRGVPAPGGCLVWGGACSRGGWMSGPGGVPGRDPPTNPGTVTAAGGTHPTGMLSCFWRCLLI